MVAAAVIGTAVVGGYVANKSANTQADAIKEANQAQINANAIDPRITSMLYGSGSHTLKPGTQPQYANGPLTYDPETRQWTGGNATNPESDYTNDTGLLGRYAGYLDQPQSPAMAGYGKLAGDYLNGNGEADMNAMRGGAYDLMRGTPAPQMSAAGMSGSHMDPAFAAATGYDATKVAMPPSMQAARVGLPGDMATTTAGTARVAAPTQNGINLTGAYNDMVYGNPAENPYLTGAIAGGINQSTNAFQAMQDDSTRNLMENVLPSIRGGAIVAGGYGGSRQGIAEGRAVGDFAREQQRAIDQFGQHNTDAAVGAQAGAFDAGQGRALSAMSSLGGQQYGVASQDASMAEQTNLANAGFDAGAKQVTYQGKLQGALSDADRQQQAGSINYQGLLSGAMADAASGTQAARDYAAAKNNVDLVNTGASNTAGLTNGNWTQDANKTNAGYVQQAAGNNLQATLSTNTLDSANKQAGMGALGGLMGSAYTTAGNQDSYGINHATQVNGLLQPYLSKNPVPTQLMPAYSNSAGNMLGGATAGLGIYNQLKTAGAFGSGAAPGAAGTYYDGQSWVPM